MSARRGGKKRPDKQKGRKHKRNDIAHAKLCAGLVNTSNGQWVSIGSNRSLPNQIAEFYLKEQSRRLDNTSRNTRARSLRGERGGTSLPPGAHAA